MPSCRKHIIFCNVPHCNNHKNCEISLHAFPKDVARQKVWLQVLKMNSFTNKTRVCSDHFAPSDFYLPGIPTLKRKLRNNAVPSRNLPSMITLTEKRQKPLILRRGEGNKIEMMIEGSRESDLLTKTHNIVRGTNIGFNYSSSQKADIDPKIPDEIREKNSRCLH